MSKLPMCEAELTEKLKKNLQHQSLTITSPPEMDCKIEQLYDAYADSLNQSSRNHSELKKSNSKKGFFFTRHKWATAIVTVLCIIILSGGAYASNMVYSITTGHTLMTYKTNNEYNLTVEEDREIMNIIDEVRQKLAPGEAAYVYSTKFATLDYGPVLKVKQPHRYDTLPEWKKAVGSFIHQVAVPQKLPEGYTFSYGTDDYTYGGAYENDKQRQIKMIKGFLANKVANPTADYVWMIDDRPIIKKYNTPMLYYKDTQSNSGNEIMINYYAFKNTKNGKPKFEQVDPNGTDQSVVSSSKGKMIYSKIQRSSNIENNKDFIAFSQSLNWGEYNEKTHQSTLYTLSTNTPEITKEELVKVAESIK